MGTPFSFIQGSPFSLCPAPIPVTPISIGLTEVQFCGQTPAGFDFWTLGSFLPCKLIGEGYTFCSQEVKALEWSSISDIFRELYLPTDDELELRGEEKLRGEERNCSKPELREAVRSIDFQAVFPTLIFYDLFDKEGASR